jgi:hypothetical protein
VDEKPIEGAIEPVIVRQRRGQGEEVLQRRAVYHVSAMCNSLDGSHSRASTSTAAIGAHATASRPSGSSVQGPHRASTRATALSPATRRRTSGYARAGCA